MITVLILCGSLRIFAVSALKDPLTAENAEIRRGPQSSRDLIYHLAPEVTYSDVRFLHARGAR